MHEYQNVWKCLAIFSSLVYSLLKHTFELGIIINPFL